MINVIEVLISCIDSDVEDAEVIDVLKSSSTESVSEEEEDDKADNEEEESEFEELPDLLAQNGEVTQVWKKSTFCI